MSDQKNLINWYPGHMAKTKRLLQDQIKRIDLVIEICDARVPYSSRNPDLDRMTAQKRRLLFLNKSDLADPSLNQAWLQYFRRLGTEAYLTDALKIKGKDTIGIIAGVCTYLAENRINILDISQTIVQGYFNMMMVVDVTDLEKPFGQVADELAVLGREKIGVQIKCQKEEIFDLMHRI